MSRRNPSDLTSQEAARELGVSPHYMNQLAQKARVIHLTYKAKRRRYFPAAAVAAMKQWREQRSTGVLDQLVQDVSPADLRRLYVDERLSYSAIGARIGASENCVQELLKQYRISRQYGVTFCLCGQALPHHPRCEKCGLLVDCPAQPHLGRGPLCSRCRREFVAMLAELLRQPAPPLPVRRPVGA